MAGNETQAGSRSFSYDLASHVTQISDTSGTLASFSYDGNGNRLTKTAAGVTTSYAWDENADLPQLALEQQAGTTLRSYLNGLDLVSMTTATGTFYYHHDSLGSTAAITDQAGQLEWTYNYDPYGRNRSSTKADPNAPANLRQFTGELLDPETGLYDLRARLYDPSTGRFLSTDPVVADAVNSVGSAYTYTDNQPLVLVDPSGAAPTLESGDILIWSYDPSKNRTLVEAGTTGGAGSTANGTVVSVATGLVQAASASGTRSLTAADLSVAIAASGMDGTLVSQTAGHGLLPVVDATKQSALLWKDLNCGSPSIAFVTGQYCRSFARDSKRLRDFVQAIDQLTGAAQTCGQHGHSSCAGREGDANDRLWSTKSIILGALPVGVFRLLNTLILASTLSLRLGLSAIRAPCRSRVLAT